MKKGDFVDVHFDSGCEIGKLVSDNGDTVTVKLGTVRGTTVMSEVPKERVTLWVSKNEDER